MPSSSKSAFSCSCCADLLAPQSTRRHFMRLTGGMGLAALVGASPAFAASGNYEAMVLSCIDPRFQELVRNKNAEAGLTGKYSSFVFAGAAIGAVAPAFKGWHQTFWDNLGASVQLHNIKKVIVINHRDCGAAKIAYGEAKVANREIETATHREALLEFRKQLNERFPQLGSELGLMDLDGKVEMFS